MQMRAMVRATLIIIPNLFRSQGGNAQIEFHMHTDLMLKLLKYEGDHIQIQKTTILE